MNGEGFHRVAPGASGGHDMPVDPVRLVGADRTAFGTGGVDFQVQTALGEPTDQNAHRLLLVHPGFPSSVHPLRRTRHGPYFGTSPRGTVPCSTNRRYRWAWFDRTAAGTRRAVTLRGAQANG